MRDKIIIRDLRLRAIIGTLPKEREIKQDLCFNIELEADFSNAEQSDDIVDTADYKKIKKNIISHVENSNYKLLEALAGKVAQICLEDKYIQAAKIVVDKPGALRFAKSAAVEIYREKTK